MVIPFSSPFACKLSLRKTVSADDHVCLLDLGDVILPVSKEFMSNKVALGVEALGVEAVGVEEEGVDATFAFKRRCWLDLSVWHWAQVKRVSLVFFVAHSSL